MCTQRRAGLKIVVALVLILALAMGLTLTATAKTDESPSAETVFVYATGEGGEKVLLKALPLTELDGIAHGQQSGAQAGSNYYFSYTDNYPTKGYIEAQGVTIPELLQYVQSVTTAQGAAGVTFQGADTIRLMATDSMGSYTKTWSYDELYGDTRYYFEGLYDSSYGWNSGWELSESISKYGGVDLQTYYAQYRDDDAYYSDKRTVFATGRESQVILGVQSSYGRTDSEIPDTVDPGLADIIRKNGGVVTGCLADDLDTTWSLRLCIPQTETELMTARRTGYDNFKWIYNIHFVPENPHGLVSAGTVAEPVADYTLSADGNTLYIDLSCDTPGATIYTSFKDGESETAAQYPYTGRIAVDVSDRDLASNPLTFHMTAVREGWADAGIITEQFPQTAPTFETLYSGILGQDIVFTATAGTSASSFSAWANAITEVAMKAPSASDYTALSTGYRIDIQNRQITFDADLFSETGSHSFRFTAGDYADKILSLSMKEGLPTVTGGVFRLGDAITLTFDDDVYQNNLSIYVRAPGETGSTMISSSYLDRTQPGQVTITEDYFTLPSSRITASGAYTLELVNNSYTPDTQSVTVSVWSAETLAPYTDLENGAWYLPAVGFVLENGYFQGTGDTEFSPEGTMTRAMFVRLIANMEEVDAALYPTCQFDDVPDGEWYAPYVQWAWEEGLVDGHDEHTFAPEDPVTREQMAKLMQGYAEYLGFDVSEADEAVLDRFSDRGAISDWARPCMAWCVGNGIMSGNSDGTLNPLSGASRAEVAQLTMNYAGWLASE